MICTKCDFSKRVTGSTCKDCHRESQKFSKMEYKELRQHYLMDLKMKYPTRAVLLENMMDQKYIDVTIEMLPLNNEWSLFFGNLVLEWFDSKKQAKKFCRALKFNVIDIINHKLVLEDNSAEDKRDS
jgi:hypothetical protein